MKNRVLLFGGQSSKFYAIEQCLDGSKQLPSWLLVFCCRISGCWFLGGGLLLGWALGLATFLAAWFLAAGFPGYLLDNMLLGDLLLGHLSDHLTETGSSRCPSAFGLLQACVLHSSLEGQMQSGFDCFLIKAHEEVHHDVFQHVLAK